jgi:hypothetical protein
MPVDPDPQGCAIHPALLAALSIIGAFAWVFIFKAAALACELTAAFIQKVMS